MAVVSRSTTGGIGKCGALSREQRDGCSGKDEASYLSEAERIPKEEDADERSDDEIEC